MLRLVRLAAQLGRRVGKIAGRHRRRVAHFTVHATAAQSARWKQAAEVEGFNSTGSWLAPPMPTGSRGRGPAAPSRVAQGTLQGASCYKPRWGRLHRLVYLPTGRVLATMTRTRDARLLVAEVARLWIRGDGSEPATDVRAVLESAVSLNS